jgi:predicted Rossmann fold flavoprotein
VPSLNDCDVLVVGGGAAGLMAALSAAKRGVQVALLEANDQLGRKILISGNGRCNFANVKGDDTRHYHGSNPRFCNPVLKQFGVRDTLAFFGSLGILYKEEKRGRYFPLADQAQSVVDLMAAEMVRRGVQVELKAQVINIEPDENGFTLTCANGGRWRCTQLIMATGGVSLAKLGASRWGMDAAQAWGHSLTELRPGLVPLVANEKRLFRASGVKVWAKVGGRNASGRLIEDTDDLLITKYGVSGFTILNLSAQLDIPSSIEVNLFPPMSHEQMGQLLKERWLAAPERSLQLDLAGMLHAKIVAVLLHQLNLDASTEVGSLNKGQRWDLARQLTSWTIDVVEPRSFDYAEVTIGGIDTGAINPHTLESYIVPGLYFAGEMLDIHADLGGFNFQWAWASGYVAGQGL